METNLYITALISIDRLVVITLQFSFEYDDLSLVLMKFVKRPYKSQYNGMKYSIVHTIQHSTRSLLISKLHSIISKCINYFMEENYG